MVQAEPALCSKTSWIQMGYGMWVHVPVFSIGLVFGFSAVALPELTAAESPIKITVGETAWFASVVTLFSPIGCLVCGFLMDKFGRRMILIMCQAFMSVGWLYTAFSYSALHLIIGRAITGIAIGMAIGPPRVYATEITLPKMRGVIGAFPNVAQSLGLTVQAGLGTWFRWRVLSYIYGGFSVIFFFFNILLPETPYYVLMKYSIDKAKDNLKKFRSKSYDASNEIDELIEFKFVNQIRSLNCKEKMEALFRPSACKPFGIMMPYALIGQLSGVTITMFYAVEMLEDSKSLLSPHIGNILISVTRLVSGICVSLLLYRVGRRKMALISCLGVGVVCILLGVYIIHREAPSVLPPICFIAYVIFASCGHYPLPLLMMYELYPLQIRGMLGGISVSILNLIISAVASAYPFVRKAIGFDYTVIGFGLFSLLGTIFVYFYLPETKDLTLQEIEEYFNNRRATLYSARAIARAQMLDTHTKQLSENRLHQNRSLARHTLSKSKVNDGGSISSIDDRVKNEEQKDREGRKGDESTSRPA